MTRQPDRIDEVQQALKATEEAGGRDQRRAPVLEAYEAFRHSQVWMFTIPAHKTGRGIDRETLRVLGIEPYLGDAPMHHGLEDRTSSNKVLTHAQTLAADAFGADHCMFSTNGSTLSLQVALFALAKPGEKVVIGRNAHKSVIAGTMLTGIEPVWVDPVIDTEHACTHTVTPEALDACLTAHPDAKGAMIVSPTYFGVAADVAGLAEVCHRHDVPFVVDDAWGAQFKFHPELPPWPLDVGADMAVTSFHKSLNGIMQCSAVFVKGDRIDMQRLQLGLDSWETSSTSVLLVASMDAARRQMALEGEALLTESLRLARVVAGHVDSLPRLRLMGPALVGRPGVAGFDETKVIVDVADLGMNGFEAADWLWAERRIGPELADHRHLNFLVTIGDDDESIGRLCEGLTALVDACEGPGPTPEVACAEQLLDGAEYPMLPRDAFFGTTEDVPLAEAVGRLAAEPVSPYPPGVPVLVPGQRVTEQIVEFLRTGVEEDMLIEGVSDPELETLRVVA